MGKQLDWDSIATVNFDDNRRKALGILTGKEMFAKAHQDLEKSRQALAQRKTVEPMLKSLLLQHMVSRTPIQVNAPILNPTETIGGHVTKEDDDGFYNSSPSASVEASANARFEETMETIPPGTQLVYKAWDKQLGQWIFKGSNGREYSIYDKSVILYKGNAIENPGLFGLLFNTNLVSFLGED